MHNLKNNKKGKTMFQNKNKNFDVINIIDKNKTTIDENIYEVFDKPEVEIDKDNISYIIKDKLNFSEEGFSTPLSQEIWEQNYRNGDEEKTIEDTRRRWRKAIIDFYYKKQLEDPKYRKINLISLNNLLYELFDNNSACFGGRIAANIGISEREKTTLMNCFVHEPNSLDPEKAYDVDSVEYIEDALKALALTLKSEGGYGTNLSYLRPDGAYVYGIDSRTPGPIKWMELWDKTSEVVTMGSENPRSDYHKNEKKKNRKGAMMLILNIWHPSILEFITVKQKPNTITKANLSVGITKGFIEAVENDELWNLEFPETTFHAYKSEWKGDLEDWKAKGYPTVIYETVKARDLWNLLMFSTYTRNDPGVLFLDVANKLNPLNYAEKLLASNPCGEIIMSSGVCNLGNINLTRCIKYDKKEKRYVFDKEKFQRLMFGMVIALNAVNDITKVPLPEYEEAIKKKRRIGPGTMGLGSMLMILGIKYGSFESLKLIEEIERTKAETQLIASALLGEALGDFELFDKEKYFNTLWWKTLDISPEVKKWIEQKRHMRNSHRSSNPPTGNTGIFLDCVSNGIEPVFLKSYDRFVSVPESKIPALVKKGLKLVNPKRGEWYETEHFKFEKMNNEEVLVGTFDGVRYIIDKSRGLTEIQTVEDFGAKMVRLGICNPPLSEDAYFTTNELTVDEHINVLAIIAKYTDMNSSKTVNVPGDFTYEEFKSVYYNAWKNNIKGLTTYRANTGSAVLLDPSGTKRTVGIDYLKEIIKSFNIKPNSVIDKVFQKWNWGNNVSSGFEIKEKKKKIEIIQDEDGYVLPLQRNDIEVGYSERVYGSKGEPIYIFISKKGDRPIEVFTDLQPISAINENGEVSIKEYTELKAMWNLISRLISLALRSGIKPEKIYKHIKESSLSPFDLPGILSKVFDNFSKSVVKDGKVLIQEKENRCPECNSELFMESEGCKICYNCGYSPCK
jgi:ribonucleoside-diphosphate reductase alpha chain